MNYVRIVSVLMAFAFQAAPASAEHQLRIMIDVGPGGAVLRGAYGREASRLVEQEIEQLGLTFGDEVVIATFGDPGGMSHLDLASHNRSTILTYAGAHAETLPTFVEQLIADLHSLPVHQASDLDARLTMNPPRCISHQVTTIVLSNGYEIGEREGRSFRFPEMSVSGCGEVLFIGFGFQDASPVQGLLPLAEGLVRSIMMEAGYDAARFIR